MITVDVAGADEAPAISTATCICRKRPGLGVHPDEDALGDPVGVYTLRVIRITLWAVDLTSHETYHMAEGKTCDDRQDLSYPVPSDRYRLEGLGRGLPDPALPASVCGCGVPGAVTGDGPLRFWACHDLSGYRCADEQSWTGSCRGISMRQNLIVDIAFWDLFGQSNGPAGLCSCWVGGHEMTCRCTTRSPASRRMIWRGSPKTAYANRHSPVSGQAGGRRRTGRPTPSV